MGALATIKWEGRSGRKYKFWVYKLGTRFKETPANFILARETGNLTFAPVYIGQTDDLSKQFDNFEEMPEVREGGATHIHAHANSRGELARLDEETDLLERWKPAFNTASNNKQEAMPDNG